MFLVKKMVTADFSFAVQLANTMDWNMTLKDFEFMSSVEPFGCFVLFNDLERLGIATCINYGHVGWFGNLVITNNYRNIGAGSFILRHTINYLKQKGVLTIGLYSYPNLTGFYAKQNFVIDTEFLVLRGSPSISATFIEKEGAKTENFLNLLKFDKRCVGFSREKTLLPLFSDKCNKVYFSAKNDNIDGYVLIKINNQTAEIGPLITLQNSKTIATDLLFTALRKLTDFDVFIYVQKKNKELIRLLLESGLQKESSAVRMFLGSSIDTDCLYFPESLERG